MLIWITFLLSGIAILGLLILGFKWKNLRLFFHDENYTYFDICFVILYFLEQAVFIVLSYFYEEYNGLLIGFFALVVVSTVSLQRVMMESKNRRLENYTSRYQREFREFRYRYKKELEAMKDYISTLERENERLKESENY